MKVVIHALWVAVILSLVNAGGIIYGSDEEKPLLERTQREPSSSRHTHMRCLGYSKKPCAKHIGTGQTEKDLAETYGTIPHEELENFFALYEYMKSKEIHRGSKEIDLQREGMPRKSLSNLVGGVSDLLAAQKEIDAQRIATPRVLMGSSLADLFIFYLSKIKKYINMWNSNLYPDQMDGEISCLKLRSCFDLREYQRYQETSRAYRNSASSRLSEYTKLCELLIRVCKEKPVSELYWQEVPLITPSVFKTWPRHFKEVDSITEDHLKYLAIQAGDQGDIEGVTTEIRYGYEQYKALYNRIINAQCKQTPILVRDAILLLDFGLELRFSWIAGNYHDERKKLPNLVPQVSPLQGDDGSEGALDNEIEYRHQASVSVGTHLAALTIEQVENLVWPKALPSKP